MKNAWQQLIKKLSDNSPERNAQKSLFIEQRMANLGKLRLSEGEIVDKITNYIGYSAQGVFKSLAFDNKIDPEIKKQSISIIMENYPEFGVTSNSLMYSNNKHNGVTMLFNDDMFPKIAIIITGNDVSNASVRTYVDKEELYKISAEIAIEDCFSQFRKNEISDSQLVNNVIQLTKNKDEAFDKLVEGVGYQIELIYNSISTEYDLSTQLDKSLRSSKKISDVDNAIIGYLKATGELGDYENSRLGKHSVLTDDAKKRLMLAIETSHLNDNQSAGYNHQEIKTENNEFVSPNGILISELSKEHETLFQKVRVGDSHYWENTEKSIKIHPEKISVSSVNAASVELAISAAIQGFGNHIDVRGTEEFKNEVIKALSTNEKYAEINLANPELQQRLDLVRSKGVRDIPETDNQNVIVGAGQATELANTYNSAIIDNQENQNSGYSR